MMLALGADILEDNPCLELRITPRSWSSEGLPTSSVTASSSTTVGVSNIAVRSRERRPRHQRNQQQQQLLQQQQLQQQQQQQQQQPRQQRRLRLQRTPHSSRATTAAAAAQAPGLYGR